MNQVFLHECKFHILILALILLLNTETLPISTSEDMFYLWTYCFLTLKIKLKKKKNFINFPSLSPNKLCTKKFTFWLTILLGALISLILLTRWLRRLYCLLEAVFTEWNNVFQTPYLGQERCTRIVRATGVSHSLYSKSSDFSFASVGWGSSVGNGTKFMPGKNRLGTNVLIILTSNKRNYLLHNIKVNTNSVMV
jgi:hypothetical protein